MLPQIFDIENGQLIINENILAIPELKAVYEEYTDPKPALLFLRHLCDPYGPYNQIEENIKEEALYNDFPGDYSLEDDVMINARKKLESFYTSPTYKYFLNCKKLLEKLGEFGANTEVASGRDGTYAGMQAQAKNMGDVLIQFKKAEKQAEEELNKTRVRGGAFEAYDENDV